MTESPETSTAADESTGTTSERRVRVPSLGARLGLVVALLLLVVSGYLFFSPIAKTQADGRLFDCGTAAQPPTEDFGRTVCGTLNQTREYQAIAVLAGAVIVGLGGFVVFGTRSRTDRVELSTGADLKG